MPADPRGRSEVMEWVFAALNSVEMAGLPWSMFKFTGEPASKFLDEFLKIRLKHLEAVLAGREWLAGSFSVADILMSDVLRPVDRFDGLAGHPACRDYLARHGPPGLREGTCRPDGAFRRGRQYAVTHSTGYADKPDRERGRLRSR
jgi:glutathione S-transferase